MLPSFFLGCGTPELRNQDFVGLWKSEDGAVIELNEDGSYTAKQVDYYKAYSEKEFKNKRIDFSGRWSFVNSEKKKLELQSDATYQDFGIDYTYTVDGKVRSHKIGLTFEILGQGLFENRPPWYLFVWVGDPDDINKYKFEKK